MMPVTVPGENVLCLNLSVPATGIPDVPDHSATTVRFCLPKGTGCFLKKFGITATIIIGPDPKRNAEALFLKIKRTVIRNQQVIRTCARMSGITFLERERSKGHAFNQLRETPPISTDAFFQMAGDFSDPKNLNVKRSHSSILTHQPPGFQVTFQCHCPCKCRNEKGKYQKK